MNWQTKMFRMLRLHPTMQSTLFAVAIAGSFIAAPLLPKSTLHTKQQLAQLGASESYPEGADAVDRNAVLGLALAGSAAIGFGLSAIVDRDRSASSAGRSRSGAARGGRRNAGRPNATVSLDHANPRLQRRLLSLLHEDRGAANRLLLQAWLKYPNKIPDWYAEKVIYDLERDRGKY
jgi:hypothetical protein